MIILNYKTENFGNEHFNNKIICWHNNYISSIQYVNNDFDEVIIKEKTRDYIEFYTLKPKEKQKNKSYKCKLVYHNPIGPAMKAFYKDGNLWYESYYNHGKMHRNNESAYIEYYPDGIISKKYYYKHGSRHRLDGPAEELFYVNGKIYRQNFIVNNKLHRLDGPAKITYSFYGDVTEKIYCIEDVYYSKENFKKAVNDYNKL